jgi:hypothetical protein
MIAREFFLFMILVSVVFTWVVINNIKNNSQKSLVINNKENKNTFRSLLEKKMTEKEIEKNNNHKNLINVIVNEFSDYIVKKCKQRFPCKKEFVYRVNDVHAFTDPNLDCEELLERFKGVYSDIEIVPIDTSRRGVRWNSCWYDVSVEV